MDNTDKLFLFVSLLFILENDSYSILNSFTMTRFVKSVVNDTVIKFKIHIWIIQFSSVYKMFYAYK